jgi:hypothetical protein
MPSYISWSCLLHIRVSDPLQAVEGLERDEGDECRPSVDDDTGLEAETRMSVQTSHHRNGHLRVLLEGIMNCPHGDVHIGVALLVSKERDTLALHMYGEQSMIVALTQMRGASG